MTVVLDATYAKAAGRLLQPDRRLVPRCAANAWARLLRENDLMRTGIEGMLVEVSMMGLGLRLPTPLLVREQIKVELFNPVQRFATTVRGTIRHVTEESDPENEGTYRIGIKLFTPLTPREVILLRLGLPKKKDGGRWFG